MVKRILFCVCYIINIPFIAICVFVGYLIYFPMSIFTMFKYILTGKGTIDEILEMVVRPMTWSVELPYKIFKIDL